MRGRPTREKAMHKLYDTSAPVYGYDIMIDDNFITYFTLAIVSSLCYILFTANVFGTFNSPFKVQWLQYVPPSLTLQSLPSSDSKVVK
jgi:hypothetical protein